MAHHHDGRWRSELSCFPIGSSVKLLYREVDSAPPPPPPCPGHLGLPSKALSWRRVPLSHQHVPHLAGGRSISNWGAHQQTSPTTSEVCWPVCAHSCGHADAHDLCLLQATCLAQGPCMLFFLNYFVEFSGIQLAPSISSGPTIQPENNPF